MDRGDDAIHNCALAPRVRQCLQHFFVTENGLDKELIEESAVLLLAEIPESEACNAIAEFVERFKIAKHKIRKSKPGYFRGVCQKFWKLNRQRHKVQLIAQARVNARFGHRSNPRGETLSPLVQRTLSLLFTRGSGLDMCLIDECVRRRLGALPEEDAIEVLFDFCCATMYRQSHIRNLNAYLMNIITRHKERSKFAAKACDQSSLVAAMAAMNLGGVQYPTTAGASAAMPMHMPVTTPLYQYHHVQYPSYPYAAYARQAPSYPYSYTAAAVPTMSSVPIAAVAPMQMSVPSGLPPAVPAPPESLTAQVSLTRSTTPSSRAPSDSSGDSPTLLPHSGHRQITPPAGCVGVTELFPSPINVGLSQLQHLHHMQAQAQPHVQQHVHQHAPQQQHQHHPHAPSAIKVAAAMPAATMNVPVHMQAAAAVRNLPVQLPRPVSLPLSLPGMQVTPTPLQVTPTPLNVSPQAAHQQFHFPLHR